MLLPLAVGVSWGVSMVWTTSVTVIPRKSAGWPKCMSWLNEDSHSTEVVTRGQVREVNHWINKVKSTVDLHKLIFEETHKSVLGNE